MVIEGDGSLNAVFERIKVDSLPMPPGGAIWTVPSDMLVEDAVNFLAEKQIMSAPVRDVTVGDDASWVDQYPAIFDLVSVIYELLEPREKSAEPGESFFTYARRTKVFASKTVADICLKSNKSDASMLEVMLLLGKYGFRRLPVISKEKDTICNYITQSAVTSLLHDNKTVVKSTGCKTLKELGLAEPRKVYSVPIDCKTIDAFRMMRDEDVAAVGITGHSGELIGVLSAKDVMFLVNQASIFQLLESPLRVFIQRMNYGRINVQQPAITVGPDTTIEDAIGKMCDYRKHRLFVCDKDNRAVRVVSLRDILAAFVKEPKAGYFPVSFMDRCPSGPGQ